jgi:hypothetical protein
MGRNILQHRTKVSQKEIDLNSSPYKFALEEARKKQSSTRTANLKQKQQKRPKGPSIFSDESGFGETCEEISEENMFRVYLVRSGFVNVLPE